MNKRLIVVFLLGFSSGLPFVLLSSTLQAWYVDAGFSMKMTATLGLLGLPYLFKLLFALFVDQYPLPFLGQRRGWMAATQLMLWIGFNGFAWCQPHPGSSTLFILAFFLSICSAVQDVVVDAQRIEYLPIEEHGLGAALAMFGYRLALLIGGGVALILAHDFGWVWVYRVMGLGMGLGLCATLWSREPVVMTRQWTSWWAPFQELIQRPDMFYVLLFILFYKAGEAFTSGSSWIVIPFFRMGEKMGYDLNRILTFASELIRLVFKSVACIFKALLFTLNLAVGRIGGLFKAKPGHSIHRGFAAIHRGLSWFREWLFPVRIGESVATAHPVCTMKQSYEKLTAQLKRKEAPKPVSHTTSVLTESTIENPGSEACNTPEPYRAEA